MSKKTRLVRTNVSEKPSASLENLQTVAIDDSDRKILRTLLWDCRLSYREVARRTQLSVSTIINRLRKLRNDGIVNGFSVNINSEKIGYGLTAIIEIVMQKGLARQASNEIAKLPNVYGVYDIAGPCDTIVLAKFRSSTELNDFLKSLQSKDYVQRTETYVVLKSVKEDFRTVV